MPLLSPVLFCIFNRPDLTERSFKQIREARPTRLFISADGPRIDRKGEKELCESARAIIQKVDWDCQVKTLFRDENLGCRLAISSGIDWFFEHVESGVILEDDCVAHPSFFMFCQELLERFKCDKRVMCVTGNNFQNGKHHGEASYYFSTIPHIWGWATWRRAWKLYDAEMSSLDQITCDGLLNNLVGSGRKTWLNAFDLVKTGKLDTWDYRWLLSCWSQHGLTATPNRNLVTNIGFDDRATHKSGSSSLSDLASDDIGELIHPTHVYRCCVADDFVLETIFHERKTSAISTSFRKLTRRSRGLFTKAVSLIR